MLRLINTYLEASLRVKHRPLSAAGDTGSWRCSASGRLLPSPTQMSSLLGAPATGDATWKHWRMPPAAAPSVLMRSGGNDA